MLDVAISLALIFFLVATLVSGLHELIAAYLDLRGKELERGIVSLLAGVTGPDSISDANKLKHTLYAHPMLDVLRDGARRPSYIPASSYAVALADTLVTQYKAAQPLFDGLPAAVDKMPDSALRRSLLALIAQSKGDAEQLRLRIETHYDNVMDRVSGWYKRQTQWMLMVLGILVAATLNINALELARRLASEPKLAQDVAKVGSELVKNTQADLQQIQAALPNTPAPAGETSSQVQPARTPLERIQDAEKSLAAAHKQIGALQDLRLPIGWSMSEVKRITGSETHWGLIGLNWSMALFGWLLTGMAASLGAPFWFDALSRIVAIRGSGKPVESSKTPPPGAPAATPPATSPTSVVTPSGPLNDYETAELNEVDIRAIQLALGLADTAATGELDATTREALRQWQRQQGRTVTGQLDEPTAMAILYP